MRVHRVVARVVGRSRMAAAWMVCVAAVFAAAVGGFRGIEAWMRPAFAARQQARQALAAAAAVPLPESVAAGPEG